MRQTSVKVATEGKVKSEKKKRAYTPPELTILGNAGRLTMGCEAGTGTDYNFDLEQEVPGDCS